MLTPVSMSVLEVTVADTSCSQGQERVPQGREKVLQAENPCRYNSADSMSARAGLEGFWDSLANCRDLPQATPPDRWDVEWHYSMPGSDKGTYARFGAFCSGLQDFDGAYFKLPAPEALAVDPHTRHLLHLSQVHSYFIRISRSWSAAGGWNTCLNFILVTGFLYPGHLFP